MVNNGYVVVVPALPTAVSELQKSIDTLKDNLKESLELVEEIIWMAPESDIKSAFKACKVKLVAADALA